MNHKFNVLIIKVCTICEICKQYIESKETISVNEMEMFKLNPEEMRNIKLKLAYRKLDEHECKPSDPVNVYKRDG
jgi:hypothetical protein